MPTVNCLLCKNVLKNLDEAGNQPSGGTEFTTHGHYGSAVSDFMDGTLLAINICDPCLEAAKLEQMILIADPPDPQPRRRYTYRMWS